LVEDLGDFMKDKRQMIPAAGLLATVGAAVYMVVQLNGQATAPSADFTNVAFAEVRDTQGLVVLSGQFQVTDGDDDVERKAVLAPTGVDADATGEAEVEFSKDAPARRGRAEVELDVRMPGTTAVR
jgi:hypothetical protein